MIENIRKFKALIILGLVLVAIALVIGMKEDLFRRGGGGRDLFKISGRSYSDREFQSLGSGSFEMAYKLTQRGDFDFYQFCTALSGNAMGPKDAPMKFFIGRMILSQAKTEFGIYPGDEEISNYIRKLHFFATSDGKFDEEAYRKFVTKGIGYLGMTEKDFRALVSDVLTFKKINSIVGSGLTVNRDVTAKTLALDNQQISGELAHLDINPFEAKIEPTEEQIKAYWENIKDQFVTEPLRKFTYVLITPDMPAEPESDVNKAGEPKSIVDAAATDEMKKKKEAEKAKQKADLAEARRAKQIETDALVDDFTFRLEEQKGTGFEELAKTNKWEVKTTELFSQKSPPKELDIKLRSSSRGGNAVDELFHIEPTSDPVSKLSQPIPVGENQWLVARYEGEEKSRTKTYEEARIEARDNYIQENAVKALKTASDEALTKIKASLAAGKTFADAAKEAGITETKPFSKIASTYHPDPASEPKNLFDAVRNVDPGSVSDIITEKDRTFIAFVAKREVLKTENAVAKVDAQVKSESSALQFNAFDGWIAARIEDAKVEQLFKN